MIILRIFELGDLLEDSFPSKNSETTFIITRTKFLPLRGYPDYLQWLGAKRVALYESFDKKF